MAFQHGKSAGLLVGNYDLSSYFRGFSIGRSCDPGETTTFGDSDREFIAGLIDGTASFDGLFDGADDGSDELLEAGLGDANGRVVTVAPQGFSTLSNRVKLGTVEQASYDIDAPFDDVVSVAAEIQADGGFFGGILLHALAARTSTGNGTSVDQTASSANGAIASLHVTAKSGTTPNLTVKVQHSADNSTWADLITFTATTVITSELKSVTGTVNRYVRVIWTISGTGPSFTFAVGFARK